MRKLWLLTAVLLMAVVIGLCGCNESSEETNSVVVGITQDLDELDPHKAVAAGTDEVLFNIFEGLVKPDCNGNLIPAVAESYLVSEDGRTYVFILRDGVKFHNGKEVTMNDVVYSLKRKAGLLENNDPKVIVSKTMSNIDNIRAVSDNELEVTLKKPDTEMIASFVVAIVPENYDELSNNPIGTGPFKFVAYTPLESLVLAKNEDYYIEDCPKLDKVTFKISANTDAAFLELKSGSIDIFPYLTDDQAKELSNNFQIVEGGMNLIQGMFMNNGKKPFDDIRVRQAMNYIIDKHEIIDMVSGGHGQVIGTNMYPSLKKYYNAELDSYYEQNLNKAKQLLAEAGYADGLKFTLTVPSNYQFHVATAQVIAEQLKRAGITAEIKLVEWASWMSDIYYGAEEKNYKGNDYELTKGRDYQATIVGLDGKLVARETLQRFVSTAGNNFPNYRNAEYDRVFLEASSTSNEAIKVRRYKELQKLLTSDAVAVYIQDPPALVAMKNNLDGYVFYPVFAQDMSVVFYREK